MNSDFRATLMNGELLYKGEKWLSEPSKHFQSHVPCIKKLQGALTALTALAALESAQSGQSLSLKFHYI